jgi:hypothetical protein
MIIKRNMAIDSLTRVCEESLALIKQLIDVDNATYAQGYEDGVAAQAKVQQTLRPWVGLTDVDIVDILDVELNTYSTEHFALCQTIEAKLKEKNENNHSR